MFSNFTTKNYAGQNVSVFKTKAESNVTAEDWAVTK